MTNGFDILFAWLMGSPQRLERRCDQSGRCLAKNLKPAPLGLLDDEHRTLIGRRCIAGLPPSQSGQVNEPVFGPHFVQTYL